MKTNRNLFGLVLSIGLFACCAALPARAEQINIPTDLTTVSNSTAWSTNGTPLTVPKDKDVGVLIMQSTGGAGTSNTVYGFDLQVGTNWTTLAPLQCTTSAAGVTNKGTYFYFSKTNFAGVNAVRFDYLSTAQLFTVTPGSITWDWTH